MNQTNNRIREEWKTKLKENFYQPTIDKEKALENFIAELLKSQREELVEKIIEKQKTVRLEQFTVNEILSLIKDK